MLSCQSLLTGGLWKMKSQSCLVMQRSKAEPYVSGCESVCESVLACVSETTIGGLSAACTRHRTMSAGRCAWIKLCIGSLLHCPFSVSLCYLSTSIFPPRPRLHLGGFLGDHGRHHWEHCVSVLLWGRDGTLRFVPLSTHTMLSYLQIGFASARGEQTQRGGRYRWSMDQPMDRWSTIQAEM